MKYQQNLFAVICGLVLLSGLANAAEPKQPKNGKTGETPLASSNGGKVLEGQFAAMGQALKAGIEAALPNLDDAEMAAWHEAIQAEEGPAGVTLHRLTPTPMN